MLEDRGAEGAEALVDGLDKERRGLELVEGALQGEGVRGDDLAAREEGAGAGEGPPAEREGADGAGAARPRAGEERVAAGGGAGQLDRVVEGVAVAGGQERDGEGGPGEGAEALGQLAGLGERPDVEDVGPAAPQVGAEALEDLAAVAQQRGAEAGEREGVQLSCPWSPL